MSFFYSTHTTHRPHANSSHFNEDARCDNEVNLILEKNYNHQLIEQSIFKEQQQQQSAVVGQTDQYYFVPIREQSSIMALSSTNNTNVVDHSSILLADLHTPSTDNLIDYSTSSDLTTVNKSNDNYTLTDADLAVLFVSSIVSTTPSNPTDEHANELVNPQNSTLDDVFLQQVNDLVCSSQAKSLGPPPGFENFRFDTSSSSDNSTTLSSISSTALQNQVSSSDTINFSQLLPSNILEPQQTQASIGGNVRSSSSSHSSFTSDEQSIFFPTSNHHYSSSSSSQIFSTNPPSLSSSSTIINSTAKPFLPTSLSTNKPTFSSLDISNNTPSPTSIKLIDDETIQQRKDADATPSHLFPSPNSFFTNGQKDFASTKPSTGKASSTNRQSSSSASSSTSSSIDDALIQLTQQQQQSTNKLFSNESLSIFHFPPKQTNSTTNIDQQQERAVHDNISFLASMAAASTPVTPESPWQQPTNYHSNVNSQRRTQAMILQQQQSVISQSSPRNFSANLQELIDHLNDICYRGFDELNALIQEQRWVQNYLNANSSNSPLINNNGTNCCSARILIVPEYFIFKCKKVEITASHVYELLAIGRPELRLRDLMFVFKSWKDAITHAEVIHQEEETKLRLNTEHPHSYYANEPIVLQAAFERISNSIRQLGNITQQARAAFQYATLNVFQMSSRQQQAQNQLLSNNPQTSNAMALAQLQAMQQVKSSSIHRIGGSLHTTP